MKKKDVDYTLLKRQFMTAHKPAIPPSLLSTMTANVVSTCRNTAAALSADYGGHETAPTDEAAKPMYAFPANEEVVEVIRHTNDLSAAETPVYDSMANLPAGFNAQYNVVANNKRYEFFNDAVANAIQDNADANPTNCDAPADIQVEVELADGTVESRIIEMVPDHTPHAFMAHMPRHPHAFMTTAKGSRSKRDAKEFMSGTPVSVATTSQLHNLMECLRTDNPEAQKLCFNAIATEYGTLDRRCVWSSRLRPVGAPVHRMLLNLRQVQSTSSDHG